MVRIVAPFSPELPMSWGTLGRYQGVKQFFPVDLPRVLRVHLRHQFLRAEGLGLGAVEQKSMTLACKLT